MVTFFIADPSTESDSEQEHEIKSEEIKKVKKSAPKTRKGGDHRARVSKERERSSEYEGIETVRSKKHVQEVESEDEEDSVLSRKKKELSKKGKRKGGKPAHNREKVHGKERTKGIDKFTKDESHSEPEEVVREKGKQKKKATHDKEVSVKGYGDRDHYSDTEVCEKVRKGSKKQSKIREVYTEPESEASSDEEEIEDSSFEDDTSNKEFSRRKVTKHTQVIIIERYPQKEYRKDRKKKDPKPRDIPSSDEEKTATKFKKSETESEEESSFTSSRRDEEEIEVHKDKGRKKTVRVDEKVGKSTGSSRETYHKTRSKPPTKETEVEEREVVSEKNKRKGQLHLWNETYLPQKWLKLTGNSR